MSLEEVRIGRARRHKIAQVGVSAIWTGKQCLYKAGGRREYPVPARAVERKWPVTVLEKRGFDECGEVGRVVDVQMRQQDYIEI